MLTQVTNFNNDKDFFLFCLINYISFVLKYSDRECPLFNKARDEFDEAIASIDPSQKLMNEMKETGLAMTRSAINTLEQMQVPMQVIVYRYFLLLTLL